MTLIKIILLRQLVVCALIAAGLCMGSPMLGSAETLSHYDNTLTSLSQGLNYALKQEQKSAGSSEQTISSLQEKLPSKMHVSMPGGEVIEVNFTSIRVHLRNIRYSKGKDRIAEITNLVNRVQALRDASPDKVSPAQSDRARASQVLKKELADSQYTPSVVEDWMKKFLEARDRLFERMSIPCNVAGVIGRIILGIIGIACVAALVFLVLKIVAYYSVKAPKRERSGQQQVVRRAAPTLKSIIETSEKQASQGLYREAYRNMYIAAILTLDKAKLISYADGVTNWEYLRALSRQSAPEATDIFRNMTSSFDELIYGKQQVSSNDYHACVGEYKSLEEIL